MGKGAGAPRTQPYSSGVRQDVELDSALVDSLVEVADGEVICSQTMAAGIRDADGSCSRPRNFASTDTATNPSYPTLMDVNLVAVSETKGVMPSSEAAAVSLVPDISCVDSCVTSVREVRNTSTVSTKTSGLFKSDERESAESWSSGRAGESAMQVETGVLDGIRRLPGTIIILAEFIPSWLLLLRDRIDSVPFIYVKDECSWFRQSLGMKTSSCHQGNFESDGLEG